jgi:hypothetical protein
MRREDCLEMFKRIPEEMHPQVNLVLHNQFVLSVECVARFEQSYMVIRGREGGTSDEGRAFFVPYEEISYIRIERVVRIGELKKMYGESGYVDSEDRLNASSPPDPNRGGAPKPDMDITTPTPAPPAGLPSDPATIAKQNLLDRIRAARANVAGTTGKLSGGKN